MPRNKLAEICYPLPNNDPRKRIEDLVAYFIDHTDNIPDGYAQPVFLSPHQIPAFRQAFYRYRKSWYEAADQNPYLQHIANVLKQLRFVPNRVDPGRVDLVYYRPWSTHV